MDETFTTSGRRGQEMQINTARRTLMERKWRGHEKACGGGRGLVDNMTGYAEHIVGT